MEARPTSTIEFMSGLHGRQRRRERDLSKRDLQAAVKYGIQERGHSGRWKYTFADVVYVTDWTSTQEVTSYSLPLPLEKIHIHSMELNKINEQTRRIRTGGAKITSHTVLVVDQSGSMKKADVPGHRTRSQAVFYNIANEVVAAPLLANFVSYTDVVTLIEMRETAEVNVLINKEPMTWQLFNKFVDLSNDRFCSSGHGNYLPAINEASRVLQDTVSTSGDNVALFLLFLSDGRPSDYFTLGIGVSDQLQLIRLSMSKLCTRVRSVAKNFTFGAFGFAKEIGHEFEVLKLMKAEAAKFDITSIFEQGLDSTVLRKALHMMSKSLTSTITKMSSLISLETPKSFARPRPGHVQPCKSEDKGTADIASQRNIKHKCYVYIQDRDKQQVRRFNLASKEARKAQTDEDGFEAVPLIFRARGARGIAFSKRYLGRGAEREARLMTEIDGFGYPLGRPLVAKFDIHDSEGQLQFHKIFARTQKQASRLARKFNAVLDRKGIPKRYARIQFLECTFYTTYTPREGEYGLLCEDYLPAERWKKWTDNRGGIHNVAKRDEATHVASKTSCLEKAFKVASTPLIKQLIEEDEESESDDEDLLEDVLFPDGSSSSKVKATTVRQVLTVDDRRQIGRILDEDILLAFSHWTHTYTKRECLVCDLQGVQFDGENPVFKLTDPAIHSKKPGRYGSTDHGRKGQNLFFKTHICNSVCKLLRIDRASRCN